VLDINLIGADLLGLSLLGTNLIGASRSVNSACCSGFVSIATPSPISPNLHAHLSSRYHPLSPHHHQLALKSLALRHPEAA